MSLIRDLRRPAGLIALLTAGVLAGCASDSDRPDCENCDNWVPIGTGLGRFPQEHPTSPGWVLFSTVDKTLGAPDADRDADEDIWLLFDDGSGTDYTPWQLTDDGVGLGDNFGARWSPSGGQFAFVHTTAGGRFEIWRMTVGLPASPELPPTLGAPELFLTTARDPAWAGENTLVFVRNDKLYRAGVPAGSGPPTAAPVQMTFNPPLFASTETFTDRHPMFAPDGGAVFNALGRRNTADAFLRAFEVDETVFPPDTTETAAWISYQSPTAEKPAYPIFSGPDTLKTPRLLRSIPVDNGGLFGLGVRRDARFIVQPGNGVPVETYCDTTLAIRADLQPGDVDTLSFYFRVIRGNLEITSGVSQTSVFWIRALDARESISDFLSNTVLSNVGQSFRFDCLMPFSLLPNGTADLSSPEPFLVVGNRGSLRDSVTVFIEPGKTTRVLLFPTTSISGVVAFSDNPSPRPPVLIRALISGTAEGAGSTTADSTGAFTLPNIPAGSFDVIVEASGYTAVTVPGVAVTPPNLVPLGTVTLNPAPGPAASTSVLAALAGEGPRDPRRPVRSEQVIRVGPREMPDSGSSLEGIFRAPGDVSTVWRVEVDPASAASAPVFTELFGSEFLIQNPAVTEDFGGVRYVAYINNERGPWSLFVQRLVNWAPDGAPVFVEPPGTFDNLDCTRSVFHPRWVSGGTPANLTLLVTMSDCPDNGFENLGFDDDPWAVGEIRLWEVSLSLAP